VLRNTIADWQRSRFIARLHRFAWHHDHSR
jgi:hypothetical protein